MEVEKEVDVGEQENQEKVVEEEVAKEAVVPAVARVVRVVGKATVVRKEGKGVLVVSMAMVVEAMEAMQDLGTWAVVMKEVEIVVAKGMAVNGMPRDKSGRSVLSCTVAIGPLRFGFA
mmetsp:Transcript_45299/g.125594  ORF Transcript_45299/g.125594 Transcript_45299/m.125594 type:complete len:118 (-) Transcript_45299:230-583(-)